MSSHSLVQPPPAPTYLPPWISVAWEPGHGKLFQELFSLIKSKGLYFNTPETRSQSCFLLKSPSELKSLFDLSLGPDQMRSQQDLLTQFEKIIQYSPHTSHPFYLDGGGLDVYGIIGDMMGTIISAPACVYLMAPVSTLMEQELFKKLRNLIWGQSQIIGDETTCPSPEFSLILTLLSALHWKFPERKTEGIFHKSEIKPLVFISQDGNEFMENACELTGRY
jgi:hypothetical protein